MGSVGKNSATSSMKVSDFNIEQKKWDKREQRNLENAVNFMSDEFGDIRDLIGKVLKRSINTPAFYDREGSSGRGRATYFNNHFITEDTIIHEFTHSVTEEIASNYNSLGYGSREDVLKAMRSEVYSNLGRQEPKYDGRKWSDRAEEFFSHHMQEYAKDEYSRRSIISDEAKETLKTVKKWFKKIGR